MKHIPLLFIFSLLIFVGCQETSKKKSSSSYNPYGYQCSGNNNYINPGCPGFCQNNPTSFYCNGGTTGSTTGTMSCSSDYYTNPSCPGYAYCQANPSFAMCSGGATGTTTGGGTNYNPYPHYYSGYVDKNWAQQYPYIPSISCAEATTPAGISYTPYDTRKGTVTLKGQVSYDPSSGQQFFNTTSSLLQSVSNARQFFWGDSTLKVRFRSNVQPYSAKTTDMCPGRTSNMSSMKGYGKLRFNLILVGRTASGIEHSYNLGTHTVSVNTCTPAIDLSAYAHNYPNGIYLKIQNVQSNQNWSPGTNSEQQLYDTYGFIHPQNPRVGETWWSVRNAECWSLDIEVAADGTKTFN